MKVRVVATCRERILLLSLLLAVPCSVFAVEFNSSNLPIFLIDTDRRTIPDEPKVDARMRVIDNGPDRRNHVEDEPNGYDGHIGIELRGSSSLNFPKKSYGLETRDEMGDNLNVPLLGMPSENDWILHGPYSDKSLMRNAIAYWMANEMGQYASRTRFCEVVVNGDYIGLYVLLEKIKRDGERVDIARLDEDEISGEEVSGGYILRIDRFEEGVDGGWFSWLSLGEQRPFYRYEYPDADDIRPQQEFHIQSFMNDLELALASPEFADPVVGYRRYIDTASLVDYLIVNEVAKNVDAYRLSMFMHKDRESRDDRLKFGPVWDFNLGFGNVDYDIHPDAPITGVHTADMQLGSRRLWGSWQFWFWLRRIVQDPAFLAELDERWREVRAGILTEEAIESRIDEVALLLGEAQERNFERWPVLGAYVWPNYFVGDSHAEEVDYLKRWFRDRLAWMDADFIGAASTIPDIEVDHVTVANGVARSRPHQFALLPNFPNPFNGSTTITYAMPATGEARLSVYSMAGQRVAVLAQGWHGSGVHQVKWDGRNRAGDEVGSGTYALRLETEAGRQASGKLIVIR